MNDSSSSSSSSHESTMSSASDIHSTSAVPLEIISEDEMAFVEAALASTRPLLHSTSSNLASSSSSSLFALLSPFQRPCSSLRSSAGISLPPSAASTLEIEDFAGSPRPSTSLLQQFRSGKAFSVTDITATEWCEKQMEFTLTHGKPKRTEAMIAGTNRHLQLENELLEKVEIEVASIEESWTIKLMNFIVGVNQLLFGGLTRELPVIGIIEGVWMIGVIDELQLPKDDASLKPYIVDTKTRQKATLPSVAQKRNARLQLMCYKYLWDNLVCESFAKEHFLGHFGLNSMYVLSGDISNYFASLGFDVKGSLVILFPFTSGVLILGTIALSDIRRRAILFSTDVQFAPSIPGATLLEIQECLKFWTGEREARFASGDERWKCQFCAFRAICPSSATSNNVTKI